MSQIISKKRVNDHGEVFTNKREVNAMLDLVKQKAERIDSRFLESACGTGNFLVEILKRKLTIVEKRYKKIQLDYKFKRYEDASLTYAGIDRHESEKIGLWDTSISRKEANIIYEQ